MLDWQLERNAQGRLVLIDAQGTRHEPVVPVRAFPLTRPDMGLALVDAHGHECLWLDEWITLPPPIRALLEAELAERDFMPRLNRIVAVSTFATPSTWKVDTDRGATELVLKGEEDIRRLADNALLITDQNGIVFLVPDVTQLDRHSRRLLDRFL